MLAARTPVDASLPPLRRRSALDRLAAEVRLVRGSHRAEAIQIAWVAWLEGRHPARAVNTWWRAELRRMAREHQLHHPSEN